MDSNTRVIHALEARSIRDNPSITDTTDEASDNRILSWKDKKVEMLSSNIINKWTKNYDSTMVPSNFESMVEELDTYLSKLNQAFGYVAYKNFSYRQAAIRKNRVAMKLMMNELKLIVSIDEIKNIDKVYRVSKSKDLVEVSPELQRKVKIILKTLVILDDNVTEAYFSSDVDNKHSKTLLQKLSRNKNDTYATELYKTFLDILKQSIPYFEELLKI